MQGLGNLENPSGNSVTVLYRLWRSRLNAEPTWGGSFTIVTPPTAPQEEGGHRLTLDDGRELEVHVWHCGTSTGEFIGLVGAALEQEPVVMGRW